MISTRLLLERSSSPGKLGGSDPNEAVDTGEDLSLGVTFRIASRRASMQGIRHPDHLHALKTSASRLSVHIRLVVYRK